MVEKCWKDLFDSLTVSSIEKIQFSLLYLIVINYLCRCLHKWNSLTDLNNIFFMILYIFDSSDKFITTKTFKIALNPPTWCSGDSKPLFLYRMTNQKTKNIIFPSFLDTFCTFANELSCFLNVKTNSHRKSGLRISIRACLVFRYFYPLFRCFADAISFPLTSYFRREGSTDRDSIISEWGRTLFGDEWVLNWNWFKLCSLKFNLHNLFTSLKAWVIRWSKD